MHEARGPRSVFFREITITCRNRFHFQFVLVSQWLSVLQEYWNTPSELVSKKPHASRCFRDVSATLGSFDSIDRCKLEALILCNCNTTKVFGFAEVDATLFQGFFFRDKISFVQMQLTIQIHRLSEDKGKWVSRQTRRQI